MMSDKPFYNSIDFVRHAVISRIQQDFPAGEFVWAGHRLFSSENRDRCVIAFEDDPLRRNSSGLQDLALILAKYLKSVHAAAHEPCKALEKGKGQGTLAQLGNNYFRVEVSDTIG